MALKVAVHGAAGRMGRTVIQLVHEDPALVLAAAVDSPTAQGVARDAGDIAGVGALGVQVTAELDALAGCDVVVDFSLPGAVDALLAACTQHKVPLVLATTGLSDAQWSKVDALARVEEPQIPGGVDPLGARPLTG